MQEENPAQNSNWQFHTEDPTPESTAAHKEIESITWTASEYVSHSKSSVWYLQLAFVAIAFGGLVFLVTRDWVVLATVVLVAIIFGVVAARKPRVLNYAVDPRGITIGQKIYPYSMFKSFSVIEEGSINSIYLSPIKRFNPPLSLYYPPDHGKEIIEAIGSFLPHEEREQDNIDRLMHKIRF